MEARTREPGISAARGHRVLATLGVLVLAACGRSGLEVPAPSRATDAGSADSSFGLDAGPRDAGPPDAFVPPPECGERVAVGALRGTIDEIHTRVAIDDSGNLYAARRTDDTHWAAVSYDACLRPRWQTPIDGIRTRNDVQILVDDAGDVWVASRRSPGVWRFSSDDGAPRPLGFEIPDRLFTWFGVPNGDGPVFATSVSTAEKWLHRTSREGVVESVPGASPSSYLWSGECLLTGEFIACHNVVYDRFTLERLWLRDPPRIVDGTLRHILPPATDRSRMYTVRYGISSYDLVAQDLRTGHEAFAIRLASTADGQRDLLVGPPIVTESGRVVIYLNATRPSPRGQLEAFEPNGDRAWSLAVSRTSRPGASFGGIYSGVATHVAGRGGMIYLGVGDTVTAIDDRDGAILWNLSDLGDLNEPGTNLSPNGELYVRDRDGTLFAIATASPGLAESAWPIPGGSHRLHAAP